jgi:hypothetical protein
MTLHARWTVFLAIAALVAAAAPTGAQNAVQDQGLGPLNGTWEGELAVVDYRNMAEPDRSKLSPTTWRRLVIQEAAAKVFYKTKEGEVREVKPGAFRVQRHLSNAVVTAIDSGQDKDGTWVETWLFAVTQKDRTTLTVEAARLVNNVNLPLTVPYSKFALAWAGELQRK